MSSNDEESWTMKDELERLISEGSQSELLPSNKISPSKAFDGSDLSSISELSGDELRGHFLKKFNVPRKRKERDFH